MSSNQNEVDLIIDILEEAARRSIDTEGEFKEERDPEEMRLIMDLIDEGMVRGENIPNANDKLMPRGAALRGINLKGRRYLQELKDYRSEHGWRGRLSRFYWVVLGITLASISSIISAIVVAYLKSYWHLG